MARPATLDHLRSAKKPVTKTVVIALDSELAERLEEARTKLEVAGIRMRKRPDDLELVEAHERAEDEYQSARAAADEESVSFKFRSIGRAAFEELMLRHLPTRDQKEQARKAGAQATYNADTFPPALIAATCVEPELQVHEAEELWKDPSWNQAELLELFLAALDVNQQRRVVDLGKD